MKTAKRSDKTACALMVSNHPFTWECELLETGRTPFCNPDICHAQPDQNCCERIDYAAVITHPFP
jgi:hypothetical protein